MNKPKTTEEEQLIKQIEKIRIERYKNKIDTETLPQKYKNFMNIFNLIIDDYQKLKNSDTKFKLSLNSDIEILSDALEKISEGNLNITVPDVQLIEIGNIQVGIQEMKQNLLKTQNELEERRRNEELEKKAYLAEKVQEMLNAITKISESMKNLIDNSITLGKNAKQNQTEIINAVDEIKEIDSYVNKINELTQKNIINLNQLKKKSLDADEIIKIINDISDKIKILSLNGSIQASHSGRYGDAFKVVVKEMRKLGEDTTVYTNNINQILESFSLLTVENVEAINNSNEYIMKFTELIKKIKTIFDKITEMEEKIIKMSTITRNEITTQTELINSLKSTMENLIS